MTLRSCEHLTKSRAGPCSAAGALILGGAHGGLAVARSLGRRGVPVFYLTHDNPIPGFSRYVSRRSVWPGPESPEAYAWLSDFADRHRLRGFTLFPGGDGEVGFVAKNHSALSSLFRLTTPSWAVARWALDKRLTHHHARAVGVDAPWSFYPCNRNALLGADLPFPVILKPTVRTASNAFSDAKAWRADDRGRLLARYDSAAALVDPETIAIQELIPGGGENQFSYAAVWSDGIPIAQLTARRTRQFPLDFGFTSTFVETVERPEVEAAARRFLDPLGFSGMVEIEFKFDARDGRHKLLDVNMRSWTWIALGAASGVDFPHIQWELAQGRRVSSMKGRTGVAWRYASRDLVARVMGGPSRSAERRRSPQPTAFAAFALDDPVPCIVDLPLVALRVLKKRIARARSRGRIAQRRSNTRIRDVRP